MYAAFWIDPKAPDNDKRIVVCRPFVPKPNTAWAVLRSALHEDRTGGIIAGPDDKLASCVEAIDAHDQEWPDDPDRMVAMITKLAQTLECTVIFRQNLGPDGSKQHAAVWEGLMAGEPQMQFDEIVTPLVGEAGQIDAAFEKARELGWRESSISPDVLVKRFDGCRMSLERSSVASRAHLSMEVISGKDNSKSNETGFSQEFPKLQFDKLDEILDRAFGPTNKRYKFILLVKERSGSILFFGTKKVVNLRGALDEYVAHLLDRESESEEDQDSLLDSSVKPQISDCRFWKL